MKIISIDRGQALQLVVPDEVRPTRDIYPPQLFALVRERYGFTSSSDVARAREEGAKFQNGRLLLSNGSVPIEKLDIFNDGIVAMARTTEDADIVIDDVMNWGVTTLGLREPETLIPRTHTSWIVAEFEASTSALLAKFADIRELISKADRQSNSRGLTFNVSKLSFAADPTTLPPLTNAEFSFDRRAGAAYHLNRFFCAAPLHTKQHITLLEAFEAILLAT